jgi:menaquinone-dependent protoporphyrinogen oxidase
MVTRSISLLVGSIPTWLFQSGPCGDGAQTQQVVSPMKVRRCADRIGAAHPITFGGRLDPACATGFISRRMATGALAGDFRDFDLIRTWAKQIAASLTDSTIPAP